jgi:putative transposase
MPWSKDSVDVLRTRFVVEAGRDEVPFASLCDVYGISRQTGYKWFARFASEGAAGLVERSRAPHSRPHALDREVAELLVATRQRHPTWGPRKVVAWLSARGHDELPAVSTAGDLFRRRGLVKERGRPSRPHRPPADRRAPCDAPNDVWSVDFKGQFRLGNGVLCYPLTIGDVFSRYMFECRALPSTELVPVRKSFERLFREFGLPIAMRSDGGTPFSAATAGGLTRLSVFFVKLGIHLDVIDPGRPDQNGRHERFHRTLKAETIRPPAKDMRAQQREFNTFLDEYNDERPHEGIGMQTPLSVYRPSPRLYPKRLDGPSYAPSDEVRLVDANGGIKWCGRRVFLTSVLAGELIGLEEIGDDCWLVRFGTHPIGFISGSEPKLRALGRSWRRVSGMLPV